MRFLHLGVIRPSQTTHYSHPPMVPKHSIINLHFCLEFKTLIEALKSMGWRLPNIELMHRRDSA